MNIGTVQRQSIVSFCWQLVFTGVGFVSTIYFARAVGADILGAYFLFMSYYSIFTMVSNGGLGGAAVKRISEGEQKNEYFSAFFAVRILLLLIALIFLLSFRGLFNDLNAFGLFVWLPVIMIVSVLSGSVGIGVTGTGKMGIRATCNTITLISSVVFQVAAIYLGYGAVGLAAGAIVGMVVGGLIEYRFLELRLVRFGWDHIKSLSTFAFWLFLASGGVMVFSQADTVIIGYFMHNSDVGIYRVVLQFTMAATLLTSVLRNTLWPKVSGWGKSGDMARVEESLSRALCYSLLLAVPVFLGGVMLGDKLLYFFYGAEFSAGYKTLIILLTVQVVNVFQYFFTMYLEAMNHPKESFKVTMVAASANIILDILLIPIYGIVGAAVATLATMVLNVFLARRALSRIMRIHVEADSLRNIIEAAVVMGAVVGVFRIVVDVSSVWLALVPVALGFLVYGIMILKMDRKIRNDLKLMVNQMGLPWPAML
ncbi:MAG: flippase [Candidatus Methanoperedens sp.]